MLRRPELVMMVVSVFSLTGGELAGGGLGVIPTPEAIQGLGLPVIDAPTAGEVPSSATPVDGSGNVATGVSSQPESSKGPPTQQQPFILSTGLAPVPAKLVAKIQKLEFVDMAELLRDNLEVQRQMASQEQPSPSASQLRSNRRREIPDLLSWVACFGVYMAVLTSKHPEMVKQLLAYQTLNVREARRCGGNGWLAYDTYFRQQVAGDPKADWSCLNTSLYAVTFLAQGGKGGQSCTTCMESDHTQYECAVSRHRSWSPAPAKRTTFTPRAEPYVTDRGKRRSSSMCCFAWNQGDCRYPQCKYRHCCMHCSGDHPITRCPTITRDRMDKAGQASTDRLAHEGQRGISKP